MKLKALVIDDSRVMRGIIMQSLRRTGLAEFDFVEAADGVEAIEKFSPETIDIAFVDWNMPRMSGLEFVQRVRATTRADHVPLVMVTSEKTIGKVEVALGEAGANAYICKPFTVQELREKLSPVIGGLADRQERTGGFFTRLMGGAG
jgi:two-component system chemotaxis response regulator CheY